MVGGSSSCSGSQAEMVRFLANGIMVSLVEEGLSVSVTLAASADTSSASVSGLFGGWTRSVSLAIAASADGLESSK